MAPVPTSEMLDELAVECMDLQVAMAEQTNKTKHVDLIRKMIDKITSNNKFLPIPEFEDGLDWFNVNQPLTWKSHLTGSMVLIDFFTYCCINCLHILPQLHRLEKRFTPSDGLVIIGCHSAKFTNEKSSENVKNAIARHDIQHPVVNDLSNAMWTNLNIQCWPTLLLLSPTGSPVYLVMGEGHYDELELIVNTSMEYFKEKQLLKPRQLPLQPAAVPTTPFELKFPGKIQCSNYDSTETTDPLYALSDSGNHRIIIFNSTGNVLHKIGQCGTSGYVDGTFDEAQFNCPQGVAWLDQKTLFVADTENHVIRMIMLEQRKVQTIIGTGSQGTDVNGGNAPLQQPISSPWDVVVYKTKNLDMSFHEDDSQVPQKVVLVIAMAGTHQIWAYFMEQTIWWRYQVQNANTCVPIAGNGDERNRNNDYPKQASFAQPSGLCLVRSAEEVFIADSESSSIRKMSLVAGKVSAVVGGANNPMNLFAYGDADGEKYQARLQHPLGMAHHPTSDSTVFVADTFNNKIKKINIQTNQIQTMMIKSETGDIFSFNEPAGLCVTPDGLNLLVLNTNSHEIVRVNLASLQATKFNLKWPSEKVAHVPGPPANIPMVLVPGGRIFQRGVGRFEIPIALNLHEGVKLTPDAPQKIQTYFTRGWKLDHFDNQKLLIEGKSSISVKIPPGTSEGEVTVHFVLLLCDEKDSSCFRKEFGVKCDVKFVNSTMDDSTVYIGVTKKVGCFLLKMSVVILNSQDHSIADLPPIILEKMLGDLRGAVLIRLTNVCKNFNIAIGQSSLLMKKIRLRVHNVEVLQELEEVLATSDRLYDHISITNIQRDIAGCSDFINRRNRWSSLRLSTCNFETVPNQITFLSIFHNLVELDFENMIDGYVRRGAPVPSIAIPSLQKLRTGALLIDFICFNLKSLELSTSHESCATTLLARNPNLEELSITYESVETIFTQEFTALNIVLHLKKLHIRRRSTTEQISQRNIEIFETFLISQSETVKELTIEWFSGVMPRTRASSPSFRVRRNRNDDIEELILLENSPPLGRRNFDRDEDMCIRALAIVFANFTSLKKLIVADKHGFLSNSECPSVEALLIAPNHKVSELRLRFEKSRFSDALFKKLVVACPSIANLFAHEMDQKLLETCAAELLCLESIFSLTLKVNKLPNENTKFDKLQRLNFCECVIKNQPEVRKLKLHDQKNTVLDFLTGKKAE